MKKVSILILITTFLLFCGNQLVKKQSFKVLEVISPSQIVLDLNQNGIKDSTETVKLDINTFREKPTAEQLESLKKLNINESEAIKLGVLAQKFAESTLLGQKVKLKNQELFINNKNYKDILIEKGFAIDFKSKPSLQLTNNIKSAKKLNLIIFNNKSHKFHKLGCKYGMMAHNKELIDPSQLPNDAKPCKFCHSHSTKEPNEKKIVKCGFHSPIPFVKTAPDYFEDENLRIYLTDLTSTLKPNNNCETKVCKALVEEINSTQHTIDFAIYGYTKIPKLQKALEDAKKRGVKIRFVYDSDDDKKNIYPDTDYLSNLFTENSFDTIKAIMHNKFFIFDSKTVLTGSANISNTDLSGFNTNAVIIINSPQIAQYYSEEFEQMYSNKFHKEKQIINTQGLLKDEYEIYTYFAPKEKVIAKYIIPIVSNAQKYIYLPTFLITHKALAQSLIDAKKRGVDVKVIVDATNSHSGASKHKLLRDNGIELKTENYAGKFHSKSIIIDDKYTIIGSMNFSKSGETINDENVIIIKNQKIAQFYKKYFQYLWAKIPNYWLTHNARAESPDSIGSCTDGIDNDFDGKIDRADDSCKPITKSFKH